jgi:hypothetical protein
LPVTAVTDANSRLRDASGTMSYAWKKELHMGFIASASEPDAAPANKPAPIELTDMREYRARTKRQPESKKPKVIVC